MKSVCIRSFSGRYFPVFGLNMEGYSVSLRIHPNAGKYGPGKLRIRTLFTQCHYYWSWMFSWRFRNNICNEIPFKSQLDSRWLWSRAWLAINKEQKYFSLPDHYSLKIWFLFLVSNKEQKIDKSEFVTKSVGIIFMKKYLPNF